MEKHQELCYTHDRVREELYVDKEGDLKPIKFDNYNHSMRVPVKYTFDFECMPTEYDDREEKEADESYTKKYQRHKPSGYNIRRVSKYPYIIPNKTISRTIQSADEDVTQTFYKDIEDDACFVTNEYLRFPAPMQLSYEKAESFGYATNCHICGEQLWDDRVQDHCHITGQYRGAAHNKCNLNYQLPNFIPVFAHNMSGYDAHLFMRSLGLDEEKIDCITENGEKYMSFSKSFKAYEYTNKEGKDITVYKKIRFLDSFRFTV